MLSTVLLVRIYSHLLFKESGIVTLKSKEKQTSDRLKLTMLSAADSVQGQGVGSAYTELMGLLERYGKDDFEITVNRGSRKCDVAHTHTIGVGSFLKMKFTHSPTVISVHFTPDMIRRSVRLPRLFMWVFVKYILMVYHTADYVHIVNPDLKDALVQYKFKKELIHYIPNFVAKSRFFVMDDEERAKVRSRYDIRENDFLCFASGQTRAGKGVADFVEVAKMLPDVKFIWAGGFSFGPLADGYSDTKEMLDNLPPNIKFIGVVPREEINDLLNAADLFFFPSYEELFPMSILEAASTHTPLLLRDLPEYRNSLSGHFLVATNNREFADWIVKIRDDKELYAEMVQKSTEVSLEYSEERTYQLWKSFYTELARKGTKQ